jgi:hypothetical protein
MAVRRGARESTELATIRPSKEVHHMGNGPARRRGASLGGALGVGLRIALAVTSLLVLMGAVLMVAAAALGDERPAETRVDTFDTKSNRTGSAVIDKTGERVDFYDKGSRRAGYGTIDKSGRIDLYDNRSNRTGSAQVAPGSPRPGARR